MIQKHWPGSSEVFLYDTCSSEHACLACRWCDRHAALIHDAGSASRTIKIIWWDGQGACLFSKRLEKGRFVWPSAKEGKIALSTAQLAMLLEGIDWRLPQRSWTPLKAG